ncbi:MAG: glycosyltransferase family 39 protein, partial [Planctomycetia bacterium]
MKYLIWTLGLASLLTLTTLWARPLLPVDETRYLTVAWEAHERQDFLVSHLNGETYAHKPPILFWLINIVWSLTGVSTLAGRMVAPAAGLACLMLSYRLAWRLCPERPAVWQAAPLMHA